MLPSPNKEGNFHTVSGDEAKNLAKRLSDELANQEKIEKSNKVRSPASAESSAVKSKSVEGKHAHTSHKRKGKSNLNFLFSLKSLNVFF